MRAREEAIGWESLMCKMEELETALAANDVAHIKRILQELVSGYQPADEIVDWIHLEQTQQAAEQALAMSAHAA